MESKLIKYFVIFWIVFFILSTITYRIYKHDKRITWKKKDILNETLKELWILLIGLFFIFCFQIIGLFFVSKGDRIDFISISAIAMGSLLYIGIPIYSLYNKPKGVNKHYVILNILRLFIWIIGFSIFLSIIFYDL